MPNSSFEGAGSRGASRGKAPDTKPKRVKKSKWDDDEWVNRHDRSIKFANKGCALAFLGVMVITLITLLVITISVINEINGKSGSAQGPVTLDVPYGAGGTTIAGILYDNGLISNQGIFQFYVRFNGAGAGFQAGRYTLEPGMSYDEIIEMLSQEPPPRETVWVTFPEGSTVIQFAEIAAEAGLCTVEEFLDAANNGDYSDIEFWNYVDTQPNTFMRAEGFLAPDTYEFYSDDGAENVVRKLYEQFDKNIEEMTFIVADGEVDFYAMLEERGINLREAITMASIIEEEASVADENQTMVSGVFWNRIYNDHPSGDFARRTLGTDVTTRYLADFVIRDYAEPDYTDWTLEQMVEDMLTIIPHDVFYSYFTGDDDAQSIEGLPVSPLSSPGQAAIFAAVEPAVHNYYYFVTDDYGDFRYATYYSEHLNNISQAEAANAQKAEEDAAAESAPASDVSAAA